jgi:hypothetical protein
MQLVFKYELDYNLLLIYYLGSRLWFNDINSIWLPSVEDCLDGNNPGACTHSPLFSLPDYVLAVLIPEGRDSRFFWLGILVGDLIVVLSVAVWYVQFYFRFRMFVGPLLSKLWFCCCIIIDLFIVTAVYLPAISSLLFDFWKPIWCSFFVHQGLVIFLFISYSPISEEFKTYPSYCFISINNTLLIIILYSSLQASGFSGNYFSWH